ncbi:hypothetical protein GCM10022252_75190 [Streptosporangium oxazolinicum]|uniref:Aminoglycoside phosphotransferase domain-containing protein n=1 Tax=Streptosporangium oxazolinicum TaxID=909287 RepID=A0ABP8BKF2_9ACTN
MKDRVTISHWESLPFDVRRSVEREIGQVLHASSGQGLVAGVSAHLQTERGEFFAKAVPASHPSAYRYVRERWACQVLPDGLPTPRLHWGGDQSGWLVLVHEHLGGRRVDLSPRSPDVGLVLNTLGDMAEALTPCPGASGEAPDITDNVALLQTQAAPLLDGAIVEASHRAMFDEALRGFSLDQLHGDTLAHYDPNRNAFRIPGDGRAHIIGWSLAACGAAWIDLCMFAPRLVQAGHPPERVEKLLSKIPVWRQAPEKTVTALAALWALSRLARAQSAPPDERAGRARVAAAGRSWVAYRST